ncbi:hypothetical protein LINGRAHAP2_LOCUS18969, partial [Linum grandiflorum]
QKQTSSKFLSVTNLRRRENKESPPERMAGDSIREWISEHKMRTVGKQFSHPSILSNFHALFQIPFLESAIEKIRVLFLRDVENSLFVG